MKVIQKILLITYYFPPQVGGGEEYLYNIYKRLSPDKVVVLADDKGESTQAKFDKQQNFKIYRTNFFAGKFKPTWLPLIKITKQIVKKHGIEIIHFGHYAHYVLLARILKMSYLIYFQGSDFTSYSASWFGRKIMKLNLNKAKKIITNSQFLKNKIIKLGINKDKIEVLHPWLNLEEYDFKFINEGADCNPNLRGSNKKIILSVGRINYAKGFDQIIRAMPKILKQIPNAIYVIVGNDPSTRFTRSHSGLTFRPRAQGGVGASGPRTAGSPLRSEKKNLQQLADQLGIADKVIFTGEIQDKKELSKYYATADVYAGPSRSEGFGIVFLEARAFGLPIVAGDVGGIKEAVENMGVLIKPEDTKSLAENIIKILKQNKKHEPNKNFDWDKKMERIKKILL